MVVSKGKLKAKMLEYFREVERTGVPLIVTDHGREVLEIRPVGNLETGKEILAKLRAELFGGVSPDGVSEKELLAPVEIGETDDSWWTQSNGSKS